MIGYAFMGAAHSQAWRSAPRFFDLPLDPDDDRGLRPRRRARRAGRRRRLGWAETRDRLAPAARARRHRPDRHLHAGRQPRRDRHRRAGRRQARAVREAAGQHRRGGRGDDRGRRARPRPRGARRWSASPTAGCRRSRWPASWSPRAGSATIRHVRAQYLQDWIADPEAPLSWRLDKDKAGSGALGDIGAHIIDLTQFITGDRIAEVSGQLETFVKERPARRRALRALRNGGHRARAGHRRRRRGLPGQVRRRRDRGLRGDPVRHRPEERDPDRDQRLTGQPRVRLRGHERPALLRRHRARRDRRLPADPRHRARPPLRRRLVAARPRARLRARVHPSGRRPGHRDRRRERPASHVRRRPPGAAGPRRGRDQFDTRTWQEIPA